MTLAYYNEIDLYCCDWLSNLMDAGLITPGLIDERPIQELNRDDFDGYDRVHLFAGLGGWDYALGLDGWGNLPVWTGSCPCQPFSAAGKQKGFADDRHLWPEFKRLVSERRPAVIFGEQVASASAWLGLVRGDLETLDYAVGCCPVEAASAGADHLRDRFWFVASSDVADDGQRRRDETRERQIEFARRTEVECASNNGVAQGDAHEPGSQGRFFLPERADQRFAGSAGVADTKSERGREVFGNVDCETASRSSSGYTAQDGEAFEWITGADGKQRRVKSGIRLLAHGVPCRVPKLRAFGNAIYPPAAAAFIRSYREAVGLS